MKKRKNFGKRFLCLSMGITLISTSVSFANPLGNDSGANEANAANNEEPVLRLMYDEPAADWESQALPIGNGSIGAMIFGGVESEKLQINESSVWSGGPGANKNYDGGDNNYSTDQVHEALQNVRTQLQDMVNDFRNNSTAYKNDNGEIIAKNFPNLLNNSAFKSNLHMLMGEKDSFGSYQTLGNINIKDTVSGADQYSDYLRTSDINKAVETVEYVQNGVTFNREYFISNPANVFAAKYSASESGKINRNISVDSEQSNKKISVSDDGSTITMEGYSQGQSTDGLKFVQQIKVIAEGGTVSAGNGNSIDVKAADNMIIIMSAGTNYISDSSTEYNYFDNEDPYIKVSNDVDNAVSKGYDALFSEHVADYKKLFDNCVLNLGAITVPDKMTDDLLAGYNKDNSDEEDRYLETLFFQYGRFLLIECSRENSKLPANLQGIWAQGLSPAWSSDFHTNINLQMNYWLAEQTGLSSCHNVVIDYINDMVEKGKQTAKKYYCKQDGSDVRGWVIHHENNIWGNTTPSNFETAFYFPAAAAWECQDIWEAYQFNSDKAILEKYYNTMLQAALFWVDNLWEDTDGTLVSNPSYSPEHGNYTIGSTCDQAIIWELFEEVKKASDILGKSNDSEVKEVIAAQDKLYMPKADTLGGQYREWKDETSLEITNSDNHRHQNQLYVLHPGTYVVCGRSAEDDALAEAAKVTLEKRGDEGTGWSKAWKINMWARLRDGDRARKLLSEQLTGSTLNNLFDSHPPYQIDGNFGATSGIAEMLLQSQGDYIEPLAALPSDWSKGSYKGLKARGNFTLDVNWSEGTADKLTIMSNSGSECKIKYDNVTKFVITDVTANKNIVPEKIDDNTITFPTTAGDTYVFSDKSLVVNVPAVTTPNSTISVVNSQQSQNTAVVTPAADKVIKLSLKAPKIKSIKSAKNKVTVTLAKKVKGVDGYLIRCSLKKNMKSSKVLIIRKATVLKRVIKGLKKNKKYYIQTRSYKVINNKKAYSKWSAAKKIVIK